MMSPAILIVGAGITGSLCASSLYKSLPNATIKVWDKARGVGGRMTTSRGIDGLPSQADLGAQYITSENSVIENENNIYGRLLAENLLKPLEGRLEGMKSFPAGTSHLVAPKGICTLVKSFLADLPSASTSLNHAVSSVQLKDGKIRATTQNDEVFDADVVISTIPVPQLLKLDGVNKLIPADVHENLTKVTYSTRFVLIWFYTSSEGFIYPDWVSKYLDNDDIFRYVAVDNKKRGSSNPPAIVFHTTVQYGTKNILKTKEDVAEELNERAHSLFPNWPKPAALKCHKWLYSQVQNYYMESPGCVVLHSHPTFILAGDAFTSSNFNGCIASAKEATKIVLADMQ